jgi:hypothetical protein
MRTIGCFRVPCVELQDEEWGLLQRRDGMWVCTGTIKRKYLFNRLSYLQEYTRK